MSYTITVPEHGKYIVIVVKGPLTKEIALDYTVKSHQLGNQKGIMKFFLDLTDSESVETPVSNFDFAESDLKSTPEIDRRAKVAALVKEEDHSHDFFETLALNRGYNIRIFRNLTSALEYLETE